MITDKILRPIVGIENQTAQEVFDIMCNRIRLAASPAGVRAKALEDAARVADERAGMVPGNTKAFRAYQDGCRHTAAAIRALKDTTP